MDVPYLLSRALVTTIARLLELSASLTTAVLDETHNVSLRILQMTVLDAAGVILKDFALS